MLSFSEALKKAVRDVLVVKGRSRRSEFWWTMLALLIINLVLQFIPVLGSALSFVISLLVIPIYIRRLHDTGRSGWWYGVSFIMSWVWLAYNIYLIYSAGIDDYEDSAAIAEVVVNAPNIIMMLLGIIYEIVLIVFYVQDSQQTANKYGDSPKYVAETPAEAL